MENRHHRELTFLSSGGDFLNPPLDHTTHNTDSTIKEMDFFSSPSSPPTNKNNSTNHINHDHQKHVRNQDRTHRQGSPTRVSHHPVNVSFSIWISSILHHCVLNATHFSIFFFHACICMYTHICIYKYADRTEFNLCECWSDKRRKW